MLQSPESSAPLVGFWEFDNLQPPRITQMPTQADHKTRSQALRRILTTISRIFLLSFSRLRRTSKDACRFARHYTLGKSASQAIDLSAGTLLPSSRRHIARLCGQTLAYKTASAIRELLALL